MVMGLFTEHEIRERARRRAAESHLDVVEALKELSRQRLARYDIFLSQTMRDAEIVLGVYDALTSLGYAVFCDWIEEPLGDRHQVSPANAAFIRAVMSVCDSLLFIDTEGAGQSLWMCWELGWFDGAQGHVAILPVVATNQRYYFGREFLGLYPYVELDEDGRLRIVRPAVTSPSGITLFEAPNGRSFDDWRKDAADRMLPRSPGPWREGARSV